MAAVLAALCALSACGDDSDGLHVSNPSAGTESEAGAAGDGTDGDGSHSSAGAEDGSGGAEAVAPYFPEG